MEGGRSKWMVPYREVMTHHPLLVAWCFKMKIDLNKKVRISVKQSEDKGMKG